MIQNLEFAHSWRAETLTQPPLIAPARQFFYPRPVPGEQEALARGAFRVLVHPAAAGDFLASCALGFTDPSMPTGVFSCPNPDELCAVAGGYAYVLDTSAPEHSAQIPLKPVVEAVPLVAHGLLLFVGFHVLVAWGREGVAWQTARLSWEGLRIVGVESDGKLHGFGWNMQSDKEVEFAVDLATGAHTGGGY